jgi:hypothetical protein
MFGRRSNDRQFIGVKDDDLVVPQLDEAVTRDHQHRVHLGRVPDHDR